MFVSRLRCVNGTAFGRLSDPLVNRTTAVSGGTARSSDAQLSRLRSAARSFSAGPHRRQKVLDKQERVFDARQVDA